jgi:hypothetical protein
MFPERTEVTNGEKQHLGIESILNEPLANNLPHFREHIALSGNFGSNSLERTLSGGPNDLAGPTIKPAPTSSASPGLRKGSACIFKGCSEPTHCFLMRPGFSPAYNFSFTAAALRPELARIVADHYLSTGDWEAAKKRVLSSNALQCRSSASAVRLERELRHRLQTLTREEITILARATEDERTSMAWLAAIKQSAMLFDFTAEVLREKLATQDPVLRPSDYETFINQKSVAQPELVRLTASSKNKIRQVLRRMLLQAGILREEPGMGTIQRPVLSPELVRIVSEDNPRWLAGFMVPDTEISSH